MEHDAFQGTKPKLLDEARRAWGVRRTIEAHVLEQICTSWSIAR
jgi:hypothetical protein